MLRKLKPMDPASPRLRTARISTWVSYLVLISSLVGGGLVAGTPLVLLLFAIIPLLLFVPGILNKRHRVLSALCFVALLYFTVIVTNVFAPNRGIFDFVALTAVVVLFVAAMLFSRWQRASEISGDTDEQIR